VLLPLQEAGEHRGQVGDHRHGAAPTALCRPAAGERVDAAEDAQRLPPEVDVAHPQADGLAEPEARKRGGQEDGAILLARRGANERPHFFRLVEVV
jgi:hypothetical protein